jgi:hypothetical protein
MGSEEQHIVLLASLNKYTVLTWLAETEENELDVDEPTAPPKSTQAVSGDYFEDNKSSGTIIKEEAEEDLRSKILAWLFHIPLQTILIHSH